MIDMTKAKIKKLLLVGLLIVVIGFVWLSFTNQQNTPDLNTTPVSDLDQTASSSPSENNLQMDLVVYVQDVEAAITSDCGITLPQTITVAQTTAVADASLRYLFNNELAQYGEYQAVTVTDQTARVTLASDLTPQGAPYSSLSTCQSQHLITVLADTLTQYDTISNLELYSPSGQVEF